MWIATNKSNPALVTKPLTENEKQEHESHPLTRGKWTYKEVSGKPNKKQIPAPPPMAAKVETPEEKTETNLLTGIEDTQTNKPI